MAERAHMFLPNSPSGFRRSGSGRGYRGVGVGGECTMHIPLLTLRSDLLLGGNAKCVRFCLVVCLYICVPTWLGEGTV